jgi:Fe-coproporphyrin III synthase
MMESLVNYIRTSVTHKIYRLPVLVLMPHSRCNCRCVMCDIWKANAQKRELSAEEIQKHISAFRQLGVRRVALSGGEALMHSNLWSLCAAFKQMGTKISLLSTGISLAAHAADVVRYCDDVILSLDGSPEVHDKIRNIPGAFEKLSNGVKTLKAIDPAFKVTARCVIQRLNFLDFTGIIKTARQLGVSQISFLPADVSSSAFNRPEPWNDDRADQVALTPEEADQLEAIIRKSFIGWRELYQNDFVAESPAKLLQIPQHFRALHRLAAFPRKRCNAPWVSAVIEPDGDVRPCFFHQPYGNIREKSFEEIINSPEAIGFRQQLDISKNETCEKCVCALQVSPFQSV